MLIKLCYIQNVTTLYNKHTKKLFLYCTTKNYSHIYNLSCHVLAEYAWFFVKMYKTWPPNSTKGKLERTSELKS